MRKLFGLILVLSCTLLAPSSEQGWAWAHGLREEVTFSTDLRSSVTSIAWSSDSSFLAAGSGYGDHVTLWKASGEIICDIDRKGRGPVTSDSLVIIDNKKEIVTPPVYDAPEDAAFTIWSTQDCSKIRDVQGPSPQHPRQYNSAINYSVTPNGNVVGSISALTMDATITFYDTATWLIVKKIRVDKDMGSYIAFSKDSRYAALATIGGNLEIINLKDFSITKVFDAFDKGVSGITDSLSFNDRGDELIVLSGLKIGQGPPVPSIQVFAVFATKDPEISIARAFDGLARDISWINDRGSFAFLDNKNALSIAFINRNHEISISPFFKGDLGGFSVDRAGKRIAVGVGHFVKILDVPRNIDP